MGRPEENSLTQSETYMDPRQLSFFANKLKLQRRDLCQGQILFDEQEAFEVVQPDWIDEAAAKSQLELNWAHRTRIERLVLEIDEALARIREGSYGYCSISGEVIGIERLLALPTAKFCVETQEYFERRRKLYR